MSEGEVLSAEEAATFLRVGLQTVLKESREGGLPCRKVGREWRYTRQALLTHLEQYGGRRASTAPTGSP